jgi:cytosine/uracil/thiamine/allantoin permease
VHWLYDYAWFVGFFISGALYVALMHGAPVPSPVNEFAGEEV